MWFRRKPEGEGYVPKLSWTERIKRENVRKYTIEAVVKGIELLKREQTPMSEYYRLAEDALTGYGTKGDLIDLLSADGKSEAIPEVNLELPQHDIRDELLYLPDGSIRLDYANIRIPTEPLINALLTMPFLPENFLAGHLRENRAPSVPIRPSQRRNFVLSFANRLSENPATNSGDVNNYWQAVRVISEINRGPCLYIPWAA